MHFKPQVTDRQFPDLLKKFVRITGWAPWKKRRDWLIEQADRSIVMPYFLIERFPLELAFFEMWKHHRTTGKPIRKDLEESQQHIISFVAMISMCYDRLMAPGKTRLRGMLMDGLKSDYGLAPLAHEMRMAAHLMNKGFDVAFNDLENRQHFDYLATKDGVEIEVECKFISGDIGRKIHLKRMHQLGEALIPRVDLLLDSCETGLLVRLTIPGRLNGNHEQHSTLSELVIRAVRDRIQDFDFDNTKVLVTEFDVQRSPVGKLPPGKIHMEDIESFLEKKFGIINRNCLLAFRPQQSAVIVVVESSEQDEVLRGIHRQLKNAARTQFSGNLPAVFCCHLADLTEDQLRSLKFEGEGSSGLDYMTSDLIHRRPQLLSVTYTASSGVRQSNVNIVQGVSRSHQEAGASYTIVNSDHPVAADTRYSIFAP